MRALSGTLVTASLATLLTAGAALAAPPHTGCPAGPNGAGGSTIGSWELMDLEDLAAAIEATGGDPAQAEQEFARQNRNGDEFVCTMTQVLPNDASGSDIWFVSRDNTSAAR